MGDRRSLAQATTALALVATLATGACAAAEDASAQRGAPLEPFHAEYAVEVKGLTVGRMRRTLARDGEGMVYRSEVTATGLAALLWHHDETEVSHWRRAGDGTLQPLRYRYRRDGRGKEKQVAIDFDWSAGTMEVRVNERHERLPARAPLYDRLLYELALMRDLAREAPRLRYRVADGGKLKVYELERDGAERVVTPAGVFDTVRLVRHKPGSRRRTTVWCAPRLGFLPVRVDHVDGKGTRIRAILRRLLRPSPAVVLRNARRPASG